MAEQERKQAQKDDVEVDDVVEAPAEQGEEITERIDDLLDEIDSVLEENAEESRRAASERRSGRSGTAPAGAPGPSFQLPDAVGAPVAPAVVARDQARRPRNP